MCDKECVWLELTNDDPTDVCSERSDETSSVYRKPTLIGGIRVFYAGRTVRKLGRLLFRGAQAHARQNRMVLERT